MAITTLDGLVAGMQTPDEFYKVGTGTQVVGRLYMPHYAPGYPGAMVAPSPGMQGVALTSYSGSLDWSNPVSGSTYLARFSAESQVVGTLWLCDRLWHNSGNSATSTSAQVSGATIVTASVASPTNINATGHGFTNGQVVYVNCPTSTPVINDFYTITYVGVNDFTIPVNVTVQGTSGYVTAALPPRDEFQTRNGDNVFVGIEVSNTMGAGTPTFTMNYFNQAGVLQASPSITLPTTMIIGNVIQVPLAAGDKGVRGIVNHTKNATQTSGTYHLTMFRIISRVPVLLPAVGGAVDAITSGMPRLFDNTVPYLMWLPGSTTAPALSGQLVVSQG